MTLQHELAEFHSKIGMQLLGKNQAWAIEAIELQYARLAASGRSLLNSSLMNFTARHP